MLARGDFMNSVEIIKSLELSTSAYRDIQPYSAHACTAMIDNAQSGIQCFLRRHKDILWITFRGTDSLKGWQTNLTFCKKTIPYDNTESKIRVHAGFIDAYKTQGVRDKILASITAGTHYVKLSGHSQGAALAVLCAIDIQYNYPNRDIEATLFGCPRVGNKEFVNSYNKRVNKTVRIENGNDIVTKVPFAFMGYRHVGAKIHVGLPRLPFHLSLKDHTPNRYYSALLTKLLP